MIRRLDTALYWPAWIIATLIGVALDEIDKRHIRRARLR